MSARTAFIRAEALMKEHCVPVVVEVVLERITNIAMGTEIDAIREDGELAETKGDVSTALASLD